MTSKIKENEANSKLKQANDLETKGEFFSASFYYKEALKLFSELGDSSSQVGLKKKLVEMNKKAMENDFHRYPIEGTIPPELLERDRRRIHELIEDDPLATLKNVGSAPMFCLKYEKIKNQALKNMPVTAYIATNSVFDSKGNIIKGSDDGEYGWIMFMYNINSDVVKSFYVRDTFNLLLNTDKINPSILKEFLKKAGLMPENVSELVNVGIDRFFEEDYVSAMHILIPQFEALFLHISEGMGLDIISLNRGREISTQTKTLSEFYLDSEPCKSVWGEDFCEQLNFVFFRSLGYKLRHKIAHGEITLSECNFENVALVLYFYITLASRVHRK